MNRSIILPALVTAFVALSPVGVALADRNPNGTGQPNQEANTREPGVTSPAGFGTRGFENAETHYAGSDGTPSANNAHSIHAVSQYDVAGFQFCTHRGTCNNQ
jgi:hypothetical protein